MDERLHSVAEALVTREVDEQACGRAGWASSREDRQPPWRRRADEHVGHQLLDVTQQEVGEVAAFHVSERERRGPEGNRLIQCGPDLPVGRRTSGTRRGRGAGVRRKVISPSAA